MAANMAVRSMYKHQMLLLTNFNIHLYFQQNTKSSGYSFYYLSFVRIIKYNPEETNFLHYCRLIINQLFDLRRENCRNRKF